MSFLAAIVLDQVSALAELVPIAHDIGRPHEEIAGPGDDGDTSPLVIVGALAGTVLALGGLLWVKRRTDAGDAEAPPTDAT